jgi:ABC-type sugar transport system ATPase subunit
MNPDMLLLDDPTKGVDYPSRYEIHSILKECAGNGMTVIMSSSEHEELLDIADRIYVFYEGCISDMLAGERRTAEHLVAAMMGMRKEERGESNAEN